MIVAGPDLLRLLAIPVFLYVAILDIRTRRVPSRIWIPLLALGVLALGWDGLRTFQIGGIELTLWLIRVAISLAIIAPLGYLFWWIGAFGVADRKAIITLAILFPTYPFVFVAGHEFPLVVAAIGVFSATILVNAVVLALGYPFALAAINATHGRFRLSMFVGLPVRWSDLRTRHGRLIEGADGFSRNGVDLDAIRMYLRWRGASLAEIRSDPAALRSPESLPAVPNAPGDGRVRADGGSLASRDDPWGARAFVAETNGAYGTRPEELRTALELLSTRESVWVSPGIPFLVPIALGLLVAVTWGDLLITALAAVGL